MIETPWHILRVAPQRERWLANELRVSLGLHTYVPLEVNVIALRGKRIERRRPLVPGYLFVMGIGETVWHDIAATRHVTGWLAVNGRPAEVSDAEVGIIRLMERQHNQVLSDRRTLTVGDRIRPKGGPFASMHTLLSSIRGSTATIEVQMLGSVRKATVPLDSLERVA